MNGKSSMAGWIAFAGYMMAVVGGIDFFLGLIALFEDEYFVVSRSGYVLVDLTTWGWVFVIWGVLLVLAGLALLNGQSWGRWFGIVAISLNIFMQLFFLGNAAFPLWAFTATAISIVVLYALTARWSESTGELEQL